ncbi:hypothetical protein KAI04_04840 [Candidatus Pacearchaeota archaeon]|nr:hypothetical protein [Candidatus Pacearchaeota archaeon]
MITPTAEYNQKSIYILGIDVARTGKDETAFVILEQLPFQDDIFVVYMEAKHTPDLTEVIDRAEFLDKIFNFKKIIVDTTGLGAGVTDVLKKKIGPKIEGIWYTQKIKVEMFNNLKILMTRDEGRLHIPRYQDTKRAIDKKMYFQFLSITAEYHKDNPERLPKISHEARTHDDIVNAIALAATAFSIKGKSKPSLFQGFKSGVKIIN